MVAASASKPRLGVGLRADEAERQLRGIGDLCREVRRRGCRAGRPAHHPGAPLQEAERGRVPKPGARQSFKSRAHQGRTDGGRHRTVSLREFAGRVNAADARLPALLSPLEGNSDDYRAVLPAPVEPAFQRVDSDPTKWRGIRSGPDVAPLLLLGRHRARKRTIPTAGRPAPTAETSDSPSPPAASGSFGSRGPASSNCPPRCPG